MHLQGLLLIISGYKGDYPTKNWGFDNWNRLATWIQKDLGFKVVQCGEAWHTHQPLTGAINLIGKTQKIREFLLLIHHAEFVCSHESFLAHCAAAMPTPKLAVVIASGWNNAWARYPWQNYHTSVGQLPCCSLGGCWRGKFGGENGCVNPVVLGGDTIGKCMQMISVDEVSNGIKKWVYGGLLNTLTSSSQSLPIAPLSPTMQQ
jgi:ADP-heptose:LPS heptosyltransferase